MTTSKPAPDFTSTDLRACRRCAGAGTTFHPGFSFEGTTYPDRTDTCVSCAGAGHWPAPDYKALFEACVATRGKNKGALRASAPTDPFGKGFKHQEWRAYYVWRLARFHGGQDVTMPMTADVFCSQDPFLTELDVLASYVAKKLCGTSMAAAYRWGRILGFTAETPRGLPATAYEGGPVADKNKPAFEIRELIG